MLFLYNFGIFLYSVLVKGASFFNPKAKLFMQGRQDVFSIVKEKLGAGKKHVWFHFASLGEFEQGRPLLEKIKAEYPDKAIVITFFSPSGYEIRKNYALAKGVFYLPLDTAENARHFVELINPEVAVFTKYEFWHHYFHTLHQKQVPLFLISGIFRPGQLFFKPYGGFYRNMLQCVTHFFVQNEESIQLLKQIGINNVSLSGDTRFDRVFENTLSVQSLPLIAHFTGKADVLVAGSTWPQDERLLSSFRTQHPDWKLIIAPHEIDQQHLSQLSALFPDAAKYSTLSALDAEKQVLIIDNIGLLSSLYQYGKLAYIGGGFGAGIHNTLEAAAFGIPVIFGPHYHKFQEAKDLVALKAAVSIGNSEALENAFERLTHDQLAGKQAAAYVLTKKGSTMGILSAIQKYLN